MNRAKALEIIGHYFKSFELSPLSGLRFSLHRFVLALAGYRGYREIA
jgi:hypothetical protein